MDFARLRTTILSVGFFAASSTIAAAQTASLRSPGQCSPAVYRAQTSLLSWDEDVTYSKRDNLTSIGHDLYYVGDILRLNEANFRHLLREVSTRADNVRRVTLDAREILIEGPLSFTSTNVTILADKIIFGHDARITLTSTPFANQSDGVRIAARTLEFRHALPVPWQIDLDPTIPRKIDVIAERVVDEGVEIPILDAPQRLWEKTLTGAYNLGARSPATWSVTIGLGAKEEFTKALKISMAWPRYTIAKLIKFHSRDPYSIENITELRRRIDELRATIDTLSSPEAVLDFYRLETRIAAGVDEFGHEASYAPRLSLVKQKDLLRKKADKFDTYLNQLQGLVVAAFQRPRLDNEQIGVLNNKIAEIQISTLTLEQAMNALKSKEADLRVQFSQLNEQIKRRQDDIRRDRLETIRKAKTAADIKRGFAIGSAVVGLGVGLIGGPEAGGAAAASGSAFGEFVYANNSGGIDFTTIGEALQAGSDSYARINKVFESWDNYKTAHSRAAGVLNGTQQIEVPDPKDPTKKRPMTKTEAALEWGKGIKGLYDSFNDLYSSVKPLKPTPLDLTDKEEIDPLLAEYLGKLADIQRDQSKLLSDIKDGVNAIALKGEEQLREVALVKSLTDITPANDAEYERWKGAALQLWSKEIARVIEETDTLRRAYFYETGESVELPPQAADYFAELQAALMTGLYDPLLGEDVGGNPQAIDNALMKQRTYASVVLKAILDEVDQGWVNYFSIRAKELVASRSTYELHLDSTDPQKVGFLKALNAQIRMQIATGRSVDKLTPLPIPFRPRPQPVSGPRKLIVAKITDVVFGPNDNIGQSGLSFYIEHPGYGGVERADGTCVTFDMRAPGVRAEKLWPTDIAAVDKDWAKREPSRIETLDGSEFYTLYPLKTDLLMWVVVTSPKNRWRRIPEIQKLNISVEVLQ